MSIAAASELNPHVAINSCHIRGRKLTPGGGEIGLTRQFKRRPNAAWSRSRFAVNCHSDWKRSLKVASESGHSAGRPDGSALSPAGSNIDDFASSQGSRTWRVCVDVGFQVPRSRGRVEICAKRLVPSQKVWSVVFFRRGSNEAHQAPCCEEGNPSRDCDTTPIYVCWVVQVKQYSKPEHDVPRQRRQQKPRGRLDSAICRFRIDFLVVLWKT